MASIKESYYLHNSDKKTYSDMAIISNKEYVKEVIADSEGGNNTHHYYYVTVRYKDYIQTFEDYNFYNFYNSHEIGQDIGIYVKEYWREDSLYRMDFHYDESLLNSVFGFDIHRPATLIEN